MRSSWHDYDVEFGNLEKTLHRHQDGLEKAAMAQHMSDYHADSAEYKKSFKGINVFFFSVRGELWPRLPSRTLEYMEMSQGSKVGGLLVHSYRHGQHSVGTQGNCAMACAH